MDLSGRPLTDNPLDRLLYVDRPEPLRKALLGIDRRSNILIAGAPGVGKTSFLHRLRGELVPRGYTATFVDAAPAMSVEDLLELIRWRLGSNPETTDEPPQTRPGQPPLDGTAKLSQLLRDLATRAPREDRNVLLIDEPSAEIGHTLFGRLRDEVWQLPFIWVVAADDRNRAALTRPPADAFFPVVIELDPLTDLQAAELLRNRVHNLSDADLQALVQIADGSPRRLLNVARDLTINERSAQQLLEEDSRRSAILDSLGESASLVLAFLEEHGASSASDNDLLEELGWTRARATQVLNQLEDAGLLVGRRQKGGRRKLYELAHRG